MKSFSQRWFAAVFLFGSFASSPAVSAQDPVAESTPVDPFVELDQLADASAEEESGLLLAQEQAKRGEFLEALGTIERVLALHPKSDSARILHAVYLCRIDDLPGGEAELGKLKEKRFSEELWAQTQKICKLGTGEAQ